jgi:predicted Rossmann fold flavoprotein
MAAGEVVHQGLSVLVLEGNRQPGAKLLLCGGGRCNATNVRVTEKDYYSSCRHTLKHVLRHFSTTDTLRFFAANGAPLECAEDGCYFSADNKARTVLDALLRYCQQGGVQLLCNNRVRSLEVQNGVFHVFGMQEVFTARTLLVATGGLSYPATGCDGSGYIFARNFGHKLVDPRPALTPFIAGDEVFSSLAGIVVPLRLSLWAQGRKLAVSEGPFLFTHNGFSGPSVLEIASAWLDCRQEGGELRADFFSSQKDEGIDFLLGHAPQPSLKNVITRTLPERLAVVLLALAKVDGRLPALSGRLTREEKRSLGTALRALPLPVRDVAGYAKAEITSGGVDLKEVKGADLESRFQEGLFFAGEVLDVNGRIGGFNLHWAWASGIAAARAITRRCRS